MTRRLLLIGGGHSHVEVIRRWGLIPEPGVSVTLLSPERHTPYSGMLPGYIAGHYRFDDCHIDLEALCHRTGLARIEGALHRIDLTRRVVHCTDGAEQPFDVVSVDTGSVPLTEKIPGASAHGVPIKPVAQFLEHWHSIRETARRTPEVLRIAVVGAGAGGVEVALAMQHRIAADGGQAQFSIVSDGPDILTAHPAGVRRRFNRFLGERGIVVHLNAPVQRADAGGLLLGDGTQLPVHHVIWVTGAAAPEWPGTSGLQIDAGGFIAVNDHLQSMSHDCVFAAGDVASMIATPRPKSGVFAVRQGPPLTENLRRALRGASLVSYRPQHTTLALISAGHRYAVASYGPLAIGGAWVWRWKNHIDTAFMHRYNPPAQPIT